MSFPNRSPNSQQNANETPTPTQPQDPTLGQCLRAAYANAAVIPDAIAKQFENQFQLPAHLVTPRDEDEICASSVPTEFITPVSGGRSPSPALDLQPPPQSQAPQLSFNESEPYLSPSQTSNPNLSNSNWLGPEEPLNQDDYIQKVRIHPPEQYQMPHAFISSPDQNINTNDGRERFHNMNPQSYEMRQNINQNQHQQNSNQHPAALSVSPMDNTNRSIIASPHSSDQRYSDITEFLNMPQNQAAKRLGIPPSTLSKRWREAAPNRKWPYRTVCKIDKEITTLLHNIPQDGVIPPDIEKKLSALIAKRQEELKTIVVRL